MTDSTTAVQKNSHTEAPHARAKAPTVAPNHSGTAAARSAGRTSATHAAGDRASVHHAAEESGAAHGHSVSNLISGLLGGGPAKTRSHGVTTVHTPDGKTVETWKHNGTEVKRTRYTAHGASVSETRATLKNGTVVEDDVLKRGTVVDRTTSLSREVHRPIDEVTGKHGHIDEVPVPGEPGVGQKVPRFAAAGEAPSRHGTTVVTQVRHTVQDTSQANARPVTVDDFTSYRQSDAHPHAPVLQCVPGGQDGVRDAAVSNGFSYDRSSKSNGRSYAVTVNRVTNGQKNNSVQFASRNTTAYKTSNGRRGSITDASVLTVKDGKAGTRTLATTARGIYDRSNVQQALGQQTPQQLSRSATPYRNNNEGADKFGAKLQEDDYCGPIDYRDTSSYNYQSGQSSHLTEVGDIDRANTPGSRTVTIAGSSQRPQQTWNYRTVQKPDSGDGFRVQEQTDVEGSPNYEKSDITYRPDGTHDGWSHVYDENDAFVSATHDQTKLVSADDVRGYRDKGDAASNDEFLQRNPDGKYFQHSVSNQNWGPGAAASSQTTFTAQHGTDSLSYVQAPTGHYDPKSPEVPVEYTQRLLDETPRTTMLREPDGPVTVRVTSPNHQQFTLDAAGRARLLDSDESVIADIPTGSAVPLANSGASAVNKTLGALSVERGILPVAAKGKGGILGSIAGVQGLLADDGSDPTGAISNAASGLGDVSEASGLALQRSNVAAALFDHGGSAARALGPALEAAGKTLGPAGDILGIANGLTELKEGNIAQGALDTAAGTGGAVAAGSAAGFFPEAVAGIELGPVGLGVAALAAVGSLLLGVGEGPSQEDIWAQESKVADLKI